ncbi:hypothetical protein G6F52_013922 [Rhizopus delemar]|nr:hypothetical protein G6F52_013922 [Rhizopus delemar]
MTNLIWSRAVSSGRLSQRLRATSAEPGVLMSTTRDTRGSTALTSSAPEVSSETSMPASHSFCSSTRQRFCASGSPPVTQTWRTPWASTSATMSSMSHQVPPWKA